MSAPRGLRRDLKEHHISWITFSATVGFGLTIRSGQVLSLAGPCGLLIIYILLSALSWALMGPFVEMAMVLDVRNPIVRVPGLFLGSGVGRAGGWMFLFTYLSVYAEQVATTARQLDFCYPTFHLGVIGNDYHCVVGWKTFGAYQLLWVFVAVASSAAVNLVPVKYFGRLSHLLGAIKLCTLLALCLSQLHILATTDVGTSRWSAAGTTNGIRDVLRIRSLELGGGVSVGGARAAWVKVLEIWTGLTYTLFSLLGLQTLTIPAAEAPRGSDLRRENVKTLLRVLCTSLLGVTLVGLTVDGEHPFLLPFSAAAEAAGSDWNRSGSHNSPFLISLIEAGYTGAPTLNTLSHLGALSGLIVLLLLSASFTRYYSFLQSCVRPGMTGVERARVDRDWEPVGEVAMEGQMDMDGGSFEREDRGEGRYGGVEQIEDVGGEGGNEQDMHARITAVGECNSEEVGVGVPEDCYELPAAPLPAALVSTTPTAPLAVLAPVSTIPKTPIAELSAAATDNPRSPPHTVATYLYRTRLQPARSYICVVACALLLIFNGWYTFNPSFEAWERVMGYLPHIAFLTLYITLKARDALRLRDWNALWPLSRRPGVDIDVGTLRTGVVEVTVEHGEAIGDRREGWEKWRHRIATTGRWAWRWIK
ncbi:hypothetical protein EDC01DRAFT_774771 [Geopyxis carbonaria]|nr:hypothetical protein EDC01DRAFT_774771 [Geopyxis carbonaria]